MVRGTVNFTSGTAQFLASILLATTNSIPPELPGSNYVVRALDASGTVLETSEFDLQPATFEGDLQSNDVLTTTFAVEIAANPALHSLQLSSGGTVLATMTASANAPTLALTSPNGGETFDTNAITIAWSGSDADGDLLTYTVQYSADDGMSWKTIAVDWTNETITVTGSELEASKEGLFRVLASDGINTASAQSAATFTVLPHAPSVAISAPASGSVFFGGQQLFLDAVGQDPQDGLLTGTNVQWRSNRDGALGSGTVLSVDPMNLSEGTHILTAMATDDEGLTASAVTQITVLHLLPPQLQITVTPGVPGFYGPYVTLTWPFYYTNYALQTSGNLASGWTNVSGNPPSISANQNFVNVNFGNQPAFYRLIFEQ
jgi:hypothetical protein